MSLKRDLLFSSENIIPIEQYGIEDLPQIDNIIYKTENEQLKWIEVSTSKIGDWRSKFRSCYIRWAISINGLHVAHEKYSNAEWKEGNAFTVGCYRIKDGSPIKDVMITWDGDSAAQAHIETVNMIASYGVIDMYSLFEEFVFDFYRTYKSMNPSNFIKGPENRELRRLFNNRENNSEAWEIAWNERLDNWQRKKIYNGIDKTILGYFNVSGLKKPKNYKHTTPETWAETLKSISILRNCLVHGTTLVPKELEEISNKPHGLGFQFKEGEKIELSTHHLMSIELFADQLLSAINLSLIEFAEEKIKNNA